MNETLLRQAILRVIDDGRSCNYPSCTTQEHPWNFENNLVRLDFVDLVIETYQRFAEKEQAA